VLIGAGPDADRRAKLLIYQAMEGSILGSDAYLMTASRLCCTEQSCFEKVNFRAPIHLSFDKFEFRNLPFDLAV
jgi:hypothetical protein